MNSILAALIVVAFLAMPVIAFRLARPKPRSVPPDLRRADEAESTMPDAATLTERIEGAVNQSWPLK